MHFQELPTVCISLMLRMLWDRWWNPRFHYVLKLLSPPRLLVGAYTGMRLDALADPLGARALSGAPKAGRHPENGRASRVKFLKNETRVLLAWFCHASNFCGIFSTRLGAAWVLCIRPQHGVIGAARRTGEGGSATRKVDLLWAGGVRTFGRGKAEHGTWVCGERVVGGHWEEV